MIDRTKRSAYALQFGAQYGVCTTRIPTYLGQGLAERTAPLRISVAEQDPMREKRPIGHVRQRTRDLLDKPVVRMRRRSE